MSVNTPEFDRAIWLREDRWLPACGGHEVPVRTRSGATLLYCFNPRNGQHRYLNCQTDMILSDEEAFALLSPREVAQ